MINAIAKRKSIRSFTDRPVEPQKVENLLKAAMRAPSGMNGQPWEFIVVDDKKAYRLISSQLKKYGGIKMACKVKEYKGLEPIFDYYKINQQLHQLLVRTVSLPSGGYICIDETEALIAIDVNSGRAGRRMRRSFHSVLSTCCCTESAGASFCPECRCPCSMQDG